MKKRRDVVNTIIILYLNMMINNIRKILYVTYYINF